MSHKPVFHKLYLNPLFRGNRAFSNRTADYAWQYLPDPNRQLCEIIYIHEGSLVEQLPEGQKVYPQGTVHGLLHNRNFREFCPDPVFHEYVLRFSVSPPFEPMSVEEVAAWTPEVNYAIFPESMDDPAACERVGALLKSAVSLCGQDPPSRMLRIQSILCECLGILTDQAILQARKYLEMSETPQSAITKRVCSYIGRHLSQNCAMDELAQLFKINYGRLCRIFHRDMGMGIVEYWNRCRIHEVEHMITVGGMSLSQAGAAVGIEDPKYLSRLFRRYTGLSPREFRTVYRGRSNNSMSPEK